MNAIDTNVLVYFVDRDDPAKHVEAVNLLDRLSREEEETVLLWQVAGEFLSCLRRWEREGRISRHDLFGHFDRLESMFRCVLPTQSVLRESIDLSSRYSLSHWDSMLLAACVAAGVRTLYSEDLSHGVNYRSVAVINPFL